MRNVNWAALGLCAFLTINPSFGASAKRTSDPNRQGFAAYQRGEYTEALKLFDAAIQADPKNAYAFLNQARALVAVEKSKEPEDYCDYGSNWIYRALASLTRAMELDAAKIKPKLAASDEPHFRRFKERGEFKNWLLAIEHAAGPIQEATSFLEQHPEWVIRKSGSPLRIATFKKDSKVEIGEHGGRAKPGSWRALSSSVKITSSDFSASLELKSHNFYFNEGQSYLRAVALRDVADGSEWVPGPITADCE